MDGYFQMGQMLASVPQWGHVSEKTYSQQRGGPGLALCSGDIYFWKLFPLLFPLLFPVWPELLHKAAKVGMAQP